MRSACWASPRRSRCRTGLGHEGGLGGGAGLARPRGRARRRSWSLEPPHAGCPNHELPWMLRHRAAKPCVFFPEGQKRDRAPSNGIRSRSEAPAVVPGQQKRSRRVRATPWHGLFRDPLPTCLHDATTGPAGSERSTEVPDSGRLSPWEERPGPLVPGRWHRPLVPGRGTGRGCRVGAAARAGVWAGCPGQAMDTRRAIGRRRRRSRKRARPVRASGGGRSRAIGWWRRRSRGRSSPGSFRRARRWRFGQPGCRAWSGRPGRTRRRLGACPSECR